MDGHLWRHGSRPSFQHCVRLQIDQRDKTIKAKLGHGTDDSALAGNFKAAQVPHTPACAPSSPLAGTRASSTAPPRIESTRCSPPPTRIPPLRTPLGLERQLLPVVQRHAIPAGARVLVLCASRSRPTSPAKLATVRSTGCHHEPTSDYGTPDGAMHRQGGESRARP